MKSKPKILIVGFDSATLNLARPWMEEGVLPNLARLVARGVHGELTSVLPPLTPPAWTTFMTGKNAGKHGVYHFVEPRGDDYAFRYTNGASRRTKTLWQILSEAGFQVGAINVPFTFPPESVAGYQISGMDTPGPSSEFIHPPELAAELEQEFGPLSLDIRYLGSMENERHRDQVLADMEKVDRQWTKIGAYLLEKHPVDVVMVTFMSIDTVQHYFWHYMDQTHFGHDAARAPKYRDAIKDVYRRLDASLGELMARTPESTVTFVVSDHGAGPVSDRELFINRHLNRLGLLEYAEGTTSGFGRLRQRVVTGGYNLLRHLLTSRQKTWLASRFPILRNKVEDAAMSFSSVDWSRTKAYAHEVIATPLGIWINKAGKRPQGIVTDAEYQELVNHIKRGFEMLEDPRTGEKIIPRVYLRDEVYQGTCVEDAPDLVLDWWSEPSLTTRSSKAGEGDKPSVEIRARSPITDSTWSGTHRLEGMIVAAGGPVRKNSQLHGGRLIDMAPTLLYLLGLPVPEDMDGKVMEDLFEPAFLAENAVRKTGATGPAEPQYRAEYSEAEAALVAERLKALGYVE